MLNRMSSSELEEWKLIYNIFDPFGNIREDLRAGMISSPLVNMWRKKGSPRSKPSDWIMKFDSRVKQTGEHMKQLLQSFAAAFTIRNKREKNVKPRNNGCDTDGKNRGI